MPTYEYRCANGHDFEEFYLKMSAAKSELPCPTCGERGERRMSAGGGFLFKGSGFYITDYGKDGKKAQGATQPSTPGDAAKSDGAKAEPTGESGKGEPSKAESSKAESSKAESSKSESSKSGAAKSDAEPTSAPRATGGE